MISTCPCLDVNINKRKVHKIDPSLFSGGDALAVGWVAVSQAVVAQERAKGRTEQTISGCELQSPSVHPAMIKLKYPAG